MWALLLPLSDIETGTRRWKAAFLTHKTGKCCSRHRSSHGLFPGLIFKHHTTLISWISIFVLKHTHLILYICCKVWCHYYSVAKSCPTLFDCMNCGTPGSSILHYLPELLKFMSFESVIPSNHHISATPFSSHLQSFPTSGSFPMSQLFTSGGQRIGTSASASVLPMIFMLQWCLYKNISYITSFKTAFSKM